MFLENLHEFNLKVLDLSVFHPEDLRVILFTMSGFSYLSNYVKSFRSDPERSREFHYEGGVWHTFVATRCMRYLRTLSDSR